MHDSDREKGFFSSQVCRIVKSIPSGKVSTYGGIAALAGNPRGARQVVRILHGLSEKHDLPWHRIVNKTGTISLPPGNGYEEQKALLEAEGVRFGIDDDIDLTVYGWRGRPETPKISLRRAGLSDAADICRLSTQLGYPVSEDIMRERIAAIDRRSDHLLSVAVWNEKIVGWIHAAGFLTVMNGNWAAIWGMVVDEYERGGIGRTLVQEAERWARDEGYTDMAIKSSTVRKNAHQFYLKMGYWIEKSQYSFVKNLANAR